MRRSIDQIVSLRYDFPLRFQFQRRWGDGRDRGGDRRGVISHGEDRMWTLRHSTDETVATEKTAFSNDLARERRPYWMNRGDCRWWTMSSHIRNWSSAWSSAIRQLERPGWSAREPATNTCRCRNSWRPTCPPSGPSTSIEFTRTWVHEVAVRCHLPVVVSTSLICNKLDGVTQSKAEE